MHLNSWGSIIGTCPSCLTTCASFFSETPKQWSAFHPNRVNLLVVNWISCRIFHIYPSDSIIISFSAICHSIAVSPLQICPNCQCQFKRYWVPLALELTSGAKSQCLALQSSAIIKTIPPHIHCQLPLHILQQFVKGLLLPSRRQVACAELELDCCCCYPAGRGPYLPSRLAYAELELDCGCYYPAGRGPRPPSRRQVACAELELACSCSTNQIDNVHASSTHGPKHLLNVFSKCKVNHVLLGYAKVHSKVFLLLNAAVGICLGSSGYLTISWPLGCNSC